MVETTQKSQLKRKSKPFPLMGLIRGNCNNNSNNKKELGSGVTSPTILNSINRSNDPYMPNIHQQRSHSSTSLPSKHHRQHPVHRNTNSSTPHLVTQSRRQPVTPSPESPQHIHHHHYYFSSPIDGYDTIYSTTTTTSSTNQQHFYNLSRQNTSSSLLPPLSPPPLSPTNLSFATTTRPSWREMARTATYQPASSISSSDLEDDDDDEPIGLLLSSKPFSLLSETSEDGDDELIPIAQLSNSNYHCLSAAEKYKAKVRAKLQMTDNGDVSF